MRKLLLLIICLSSVPCFAGSQWQGSIPKPAQDANKWHDLINAMMEHKMYYGALAASSRTLMFFSDLPTKELAYKTIINLIDLGYPFPAKGYFTTGDIEPEEGTDFANSYNFYKGLIAREKGMSQWAEHYFSNVDKDKLPRYLFYSAVEAYSKGDLDSAEKDLKKILSEPLGPEQASMVQKTARTLARIYFEREQYAKSLDIYENFLLRVNPILPSDWLETAWDLYYLKRFDQALGVLFNLEAKSSAGLIDLEKYELRALIYQGLCDTGRMQLLLKTFEHDFGNTITAIKSGEALAHLPALKTLYYPANAGYYQNLTTIQNLQAESQNTENLPGDLRELARYLYSTELQMLRRKINSYVELAMANAARHLITLSENLRFLKFDVSREQFNPETVFQQTPSDKKPDSYVEDDQSGFQIHWAQMGDYWRDERAFYKAVVKNRCADDTSSATPPSPDTPQ